MLFLVIADRQLFWQNEFLNSVNIIQIVDDIVDSGQTLARLLSLVDEYEPKSVHSAILLDKRVPQRKVAS